MQKEIIYPPLGWPNHDNVVPSKPLPKVLYRPVPEDLLALAENGRHAKNLVLRDPGHEKSLQSWSVALNSPIVGRQLRDLWNGAREEGLVVDWKHQFLELLGLKALVDHIQRVDMTEPFAGFMIDQLFRFQGFSDGDLVFRVRVAAPAGI